MNKSQTAGKKEVLTWSHAAVGSTPHSHVGRDPDNGFESATPGL